MLSCVFDTLPNYKEVQKAVAYELKLYRALKVRIENKREQEEAGINRLFTSLRNSDRESELKVKQFERAIQCSLDEIERKIIKMKYLSPVEVNDEVIAREIGLKKDKFYRKKRTAILQIAIALGII